MIALDKVRPLPPYIMVERLPAETEFKHLKIVLPEEQNSKNRKVKVLETHMGRKFSGNTYFSPVTPGSTVLLLVFDGQDMSSYDQKNIEFCNEDDILCICHDSEGVFPLQPLGNRIVVEVESAIGMTAGGLILPGVREERPDKGIVVAIGPGRRTSTGKYVGWELSAGDKVLFEKFTGVKVTIDRKNYLILDEKDVLGQL